MLKKSDKDIKLISDQTSSLKCKNYIVHFILDGNIV